MEQTYRLEFNEEKQWLRLDNYITEPNINGWYTITDYCTDFEFHIFEAYVNKTGITKLTNEYLLKSLSEIIGLINNLAEYGISITKNAPVFDNEVFKGNKPPTQVRFTVKKSHLFNRIKN